MRLARVILFTNEMDAMTVFYRDVVGLAVVSEEQGWREFDAGGARRDIRHRSARRALTARNARRLIAIVAPSRRADQRRSH